MGGSFLGPLLSHSNQLTMKDSHVCSAVGGGGGVEGTHRTDAIISAQRANSPATVLSTLPFLGASAPTQ